MLQKGFITNYILLYATVVWWPMAQKVEVMVLLKSLQENSQSAMKGTIRTTPMPLGMPPLDLLIMHDTETTTYVEEEMEASKSKTCPAEDPLESHS